MWQKCDTYGTDIFIYVARRRQEQKCQKNPRTVLFHFKVTQNCQREREKKMKFRKTLFSVQRSKQRGKRYY